MKKNHIAIMAVALFAAGSMTAQAAAVIKGKFITANETWVAATTYVLTELTYVTSGATLTIEPGTTILGAGSTAGNPAALMISRGAKINAVGTATDPIIFTSVNDDRVPNGSQFNVGGSVDSALPFGTGTTNTDTKAGVDSRSSLWGGVIILGRGFHSGSTTAVNFDEDATKLVEGLADDGLPDGGGFIARAHYGGDAAAVANDNDDSGSLKYLSIRYGGVGLVVNTEVNGLTMGGVGRETDIEFIEVVNNLDDGFEWFGGTVNMKYIATYSIGDDCFDWDEGYRGKGQFWVGFQGACAAVASPGSGLADKAGEFDGSAAASDARLPISIPLIYNMTVIGCGSDYATTGEEPRRNSGPHIRDNSGGLFRNTVFIEPAGFGLLVANEKNATTVPTNGTDADSAARAFTSYDETAYSASATTNPVLLNAEDIAGSMELDIRETIWFNVSQSRFSPDTAPADTADFVAASDGGISAGEVGFALGVVNMNASNDTDVASLPIVSRTRRAHSALSADIQLDFIDPRAANDALTSSITAPADGFFTPVSYKGAFSPSNNWMVGWSLMDDLGIFNGTQTTADPASADSELFFAVSFPTAVDAVYSVNASSNPAGPFSPIGVATGDGGTVTFVDTRTLTTKQFYEVVAQ